ncbi:MaoC/PaaZ C-terminal domain-containing protein [Nocardia mexicana]|uniref:MaoC dehydratase-like protein n=1 Tax=Nocardia mexicana TaxID=279262 RepID=A0A370GNZ8_9NOCA|nr:MaoC/PaaZ C-terminal domain-containing protein [Nocardia mexicana]RDI45241.1 MaoC dehydratase-like protein [Nocardia mexicana]
MNPHRSAALPEAGTALPGREFVVSRSDLIRYAGASRDYNPIHWSDRIARRSGLPGVVAHGMLTMSLAVRTVTEWAGPEATVVDYRASFANPVVVPDDDGVTLSVTATVAEHLGEDRIRFRLSVRLGDSKVLTKSYVVIQLRRAS